MHKSIQILFMLILSFTVFPSWAETEPATNNNAIYYAIEEPFTLNFLNQSNQKVRFLQIKVTLMAHNQAIIDSAELNLPMLQDALRTLFSAQTPESITSVAGRRALQTTSLDTVKAILKGETGRDNLDAVYFTSFILQ